MFESAHEELRSLEPVGLSRAELESGFRALSRLESRVVERRLAYTAVIDDLDDGGLDGEGLTRSAGRRSKRAARKASRTASKLKKMPRIRDALATGRITEEHATAAADAAERTSPEEVDEELSGSAAERPADLFAGSARRWAGAKERDSDARSRHERQRSDREFRRWTDADGMRCIFGRFAPDDGAVFEKRLRAEIDRLWRLDGGRGGSPDEIRTADQRASDALLGLVTAPMMSTKKRPHPKYQVVVKVDGSRLRVEDPEGMASVATASLCPSRCSGGSAATRSSSARSTARTAPSSGRDDVPVSPPTTSGRNSSPAMGAASDAARLPSTVKPTMSCRSHRRPGAPPTSTASPCCAPTITISSMSTATRWRGEATDGSCDRRRSEDRLPGPGRRDWSGRETTARDPGRSPRIPARSVGGR